MSDNDPTPQRARQRRSSLFLPVLLIVAGVVLLIGRFGLFDWGVLLGVLELWPLLLIALGADILTRGRYRMPIVLGVVALGAVFYYTPGLAPARGGPAETHEIAYELGEARAADVELRHGVGVLNLGVLPANSELMVGGEIGTGNRERLVRSYEVRDGVARLRLAGESRGPSFGVRGHERTWNLELTRAVSIDLDIDAGVGESHLNLREATLGSFDLDAGVGQVNLTLPERGGYRGEIDAGVGEVVVRVPRQVEARFTVSTGLGGATVNGDWTTDGNVHTTAGYSSASAEERIDVRVDGGVGQITVQQID